ncbi:hypothetical protein OHV97_23190 [Streptomyces virginiae]
MQAGQVHEAGVEELGVAGEPGMRGGGPQLPGEGPRSEADGLHVGEGEVAQCVQGGGEGGRHAGLLAGRQGAFPGGP